MSSSKPPVLKIHFLKPGEVRKFRRRRPADEEIGIKFDSSQFYSLKACLERVLGHPIYLRLKDYAPLKEWRKAIVRLLDAVELAINSTVQIVDQEWRDDVAEVIGRGRDLIRVTETSSGLFAVLSATLTEIVFLQLGSVPSRSNQAKTAPLTADYWTFNRFRSVQYVQSAVQRTALAGLIASRRNSGDFDITG